MSFAGLTEPLIERLSIGGQRSHVTELARVKQVRSLSSGSANHAGRLLSGGGETTLRIRRAFANAADRLRRRGFIALAGSATAWRSSRARAQAMPVIGYLGSESPERYGSRLGAFREGLADAGYAEGRTVAIEFRWAEGQYNRLPALAKELANRPVAVIVAPGGAEIALAAKSATTNNPDRLRDGWRSRCARRRRQPVSARRQSHRRVEPQRRGLAQAAGVHARGAAGRRTASPSPSIRRARPRSRN